MSGAAPCEGTAARELRPLPCPASQERPILHVASLEEDPNAKPEVRFLMMASHLHTIVKSKNLLSDHS